VTYPLERANSHKAELVLDSVNYFLEYGLKPDVFKLEYPGDPIACSQISRLLKKTPWILLTKGDNFEKFKQDLITAVKNGASGFLAGRSLWQGFSKLPKEQWAEYFNTVAKERFTEIVRICHS
jgi:tagatose 1,6-diphosphate aldolase